MKKCKICTTPEQCETQNECDTVKQFKESLNDPPQMCSKEVCDCDKKNC